MAEEDTAIKFSKANPYVLKSLATNHSWAFSAIAELIDNAYDPDAGAKKIHIDMDKIDLKVCLTIRDNGKGMDMEHMWNMLSYGYCEKAKYKDDARSPIGQYGIGFKSGSMRLGRDALVLTHHKNSGTASVGFLSQTYQEAICKDGTQGAKGIKVPMITSSTYPKLEKSKESDMNLKAILEHSVYHTEEEIEEALDELKEGGTKIIIFNLERDTRNGTVSTRHGLYELDFTTDYQDIRLHIEKSENVPSFNYSLREFCSILFRYPVMDIFIRGIKVDAVDLETRLDKTCLYFYNPRIGKDPVKIVCGMSRRARDSDIRTMDYGLMLYHRNRLITAYEKIGCQKAKSPSAVDVVILAEADHLTANNNKCGFQDNTQYKNTMKILCLKLKTYWDAIEKTKNSPASHEDYPRGTPIATDNVGAVPSTSFSPDRISEKNGIRIEKMYTELTTSEQNVTGNPHNTNIKKRKRSGPNKDKLASYESNKVKKKTGSTNWILNMLNTSPKRFRPSKEPLPSYESNQIEEETDSTNCFSNLTNTFPPLKKNQCDKGIQTDLHTPSGNSNFKRNLLLQIILAFILVMIMMILKVVSMKC